MPRKNTSPFILQVPPEPLRRWLFFSSRTGENTRDTKTQRLMATVNKISTLTRFPATLTQDPPEFGASVSPWVYLHRRQEDSGSLQAEAQGRISHSGRRQTLLGPSQQLVSTFTNHIMHPWKEVCGEADYCSLCFQRSKQRKRKKKKTWIIIGWH